MSHPVRTSLVGSSLLLAGLAVGFAGEEISSSTKLSKANFVEVRKAILLPSETRWSKIPWRPDLGEAIDEARVQDRPILLGMMNGHPCGMT